jgi:endonuclease YncB( thermonuclease family)
MIRPIALALMAFTYSVTAGAEPTSVKVVCCYDGDTCRLEREILPGRNRVRFANVDTPEIEGKCRE